MFTGTTSPYNHHGYTGMRYDGKTGLVDLNARWYNPTAGKFMNEDTYPGELSQPQTQNRYSYALNNPVNMWDPSGHVSVPIEGNEMLSWVKNKSDYSYDDKTSPTDSFYTLHDWDYISSSHNESDTRLVNEVMELRGYNQTYQKDISNTWTYDYQKYLVVNEFKRSDEQYTVTFEESYTEQWEDFITAEEIAGQNAEEIAKYGAPANAKRLNTKVKFPTSYDQYVERQLKNHLRQVKPEVPIQWIFERIDNYLLLNENEFEIPSNNGDLVLINGGEYPITYAGYSRVLGNSTGVGDLEAFGHITVITLKYLTEDIGTMLSPDSTFNERALAALFTFVKPIKAADTVWDIVKGTDKSVKPNDVVSYRPSNSPLENHHGVMDVWAKHNVPNYVSRGGNTPTIALTKEQHDATKDVYRQWLYEKTGKKVGGKVDWESVSPKEMQELTEKMFDAAKVPNSARQEYYNAFNRYNYRE
ncbi:MAG: RHS repeat-associated core domain-containing protein [Paenisporosarcina sp.]